MKSAIVVDSTAGLAQELAGHPDVYQVTLSLNFPDGGTYEDTVEETQVKAFYNQLASSDKLPKTSQPQPSAYIAIFDQLVADGYEEVYMITLSSALSGTLQSAMMIAKDYADKLNIHAIDSKAVSVIMEYMVKATLDYIDADLAPATIVKKLEWIAERAHIYVMIDDLEALSKGGRVSVASAWLGNMLRIIPVLEFKEDGTVGLHEKIRSYKKVKKRWKELITEAIDTYPNGVLIAFAHGDNEEKALDMQAYIKESFPDNAYRIAYLTPVLGTHGGKGCLGLGIIPLQPADAEI